MTCLNQPAPLVIRSAPTGLMEELHCKEGYVHAHDTQEKMARMTCLPEDLKNRRFCLPTEEDAETIRKQRLERRNHLDFTF